MCGELIIERAKGEGENERVKRRKRRRVQRAGAELTRRASEECRRSQRLPQIEEKKRGDV